MKLKTSQNWATGCASMLIAGFSLAACGSDTSTEADKSETGLDESPVVAITAETKPNADDSSEVESAEPAPLATLEHDYFGGFEFDYPSDHLADVRGPDDYIVVHLPGYEDAFIESLLLFTRLSQTWNGDPVGTIDELIEIAEVVGGGEVTEGTDSIEVFGRELQQFHFENVAESPIFSGSPRGFPSDNFWAPAYHTDLYLAELDESVLVLMAQGANDEALKELDPLLREIAATMRLTTDDGEIAPLPEPDVAAAIDFGPPPEIVAAERLDIDVPVMSRPTFQPVPERYQFLKMGFPIEITIPEESIHPANESGLIVVADTQSRGPYELDLRVHLTVGNLVPFGAGEVPIGQPIPVDSIEELFANPPANLEFTNVITETEIGGQPGVQFDVAIIDSDDCSGAENPCNYAFMGPFAEYALLLGDGHVHRVWFVPNVPNGPLLLIASVSADEADRWLTKVDQMISSLKISLTG